MRSHFFLEYIMLQWTSPVFCIFFVLPEDAQVGHNMLQWIISSDNKFWMWFNGLF
jgi:hypothetical protein